jgi:hypothetical protein
MQIKLTRPQYDAIPRLLGSIKASGVTGVTITRPTASDDSPLPYVRVEFSAGYGNVRFDIDQEGNSEQVTFGESSISLDVIERLAEIGRGGLTAARTLIG